MSSNELFTRFVEAGRLCTVEYGPYIQKLAVIVDIIDQNRVLVDGPTTGVARHSIPLKWIKLTEVIVKGVKRGCSTVTLQSLLEKQNSIQAYNSSFEGKKRLALLFRENMTDFERFKLMVAQKRRRDIMRKEVSMKS